MTNTYTPTPAKKRFISLLKELRSNLRRGYHLKRVRGRTKIKLINVKGAPKWMK